MHVSNCYACISLPEVDAGNYGDIMSMRYDGDVGLCACRLHGMI